MSGLNEGNATSAEDYALVELADKAQLDAFGRLRICSPETLFESAFRYDKQPVTFTESTTSGGTVTHDANKASVDLAVTTTTNSEARFQSRRTIRYHPGKSHLIQISCNFNSGATNVVKRFGYYDDNNGAFFELSGTTLNVVRRTKTSGSVVDSATAQSSWNIDKFDGTGPSGFTLDLSKQHLLAIDFTWLGSGRIRYGFFMDGKIYYCHAETISNILTVPWAQTADLPIRCEIKNNLSTASSMHLTCVVVICENFISPNGLLRSINNGITSRIVNPAGAVVPIISIRKQSAFIDCPVKIQDAGVFGASNDDMIFSIIYNGTLTGASFASVSGICERDVSATAITGGTVVYSSYLRSEDHQLSVVISDGIKDVNDGFLGRDLAGASDTYSVVITSISGSLTVFGFINYKELL